MDDDELDKDLRASLRIQDEDELLRFQEAFIASKQAPSVKVVHRNKAQGDRVQGSSTPAEAAKPSTSKPPSRFAQRAAAVGSHAAPSSAVFGILGDVEEKWDAEAPKAPSMPKPGQVPHHAGFPVAAPAARAPPLGRTAPAMAGHAASGPKDERSQIDEENRRRIAGMSKEEIVDAQAEIARLLPPHLLQSLKKGGLRQRAAADDGGDPSAAGPQRPPEAAAPAPPPTARGSAANELEQDDKDLEDAVRREIDNLLPDHERWFRGVPVESAKLAWTLPAQAAVTKRAQPAAHVEAMLRGLSAVTEEDVESARIEDMLRKQVHGTETVATLRFDFDGEIAGKQSRVHSALFHHGDEPERPGYTVAELRQLLRSAVQSQRLMALRALRGIVQRVKLGAFPEEACVSLMDYFVGEPAFAIFAVEALGDTSDAVVLAGLHLIGAIICSADEDDVLLRWRLTRYSPLEFWYCPASSEPNRVDLSIDLLANFLHAGVIDALTNVLLHASFAGDQSATDLLLRCLARLARHSPGAAAGVLTTAGLLDAIARNFVAVPWPLSGEAVQAKPLAIDVLCAIASSGAKAAERISADYAPLVSRFLLKRPGPTASEEDRARACDLQVHSLLLLETLARYGRGAELFADVHDALNATFVTDVCGVATEAPAHGARRVAVATLRYYAAVVPLLPEHMRCGALWPQITSLVPRAFDMAQALPAAMWSMRDDDDTWGVYLVAAAFKLAAQCHRVAPFLPFYTPKVFVEEAEGLWAGLVDGPRAWLSRLLSSAADAAHAADGLSALLESTQQPSVLQLARYIGGYSQLPGIYTTSAVRVAGFLWRLSAPHHMISGVMDLLSALARLARGLSVPLAALLRSPLAINMLAMARTVSDELRPVLRASRRMCALAGGPAACQSSWLSACDDAGAALWTTMDLEFARLLFLTLLRTLRDAPPGHERAVVAAMQMLHRAEYIGLLAERRERSLYADVQAFIQPSWASAFVSPGVVAAMHCEAVPPQLKQTLVFHLADLKTPPPADFVFKPLQLVFAAVCGGADPTPLNDDDAEAVRATLQFCVWMDRTAPAFSAQIPPASRLAALMQVFLLGDALFRRPSIDGLLGDLVSRWTARGAFASDAPGNGGARLASYAFQTLAFDFIRQFAAVSLGHRPFVQLAVVLLNNIFPVDVRLAFWADLAELYASFEQVDEATVPQPLGLTGYFEPADTDERLLSAYCRALVQPRRPLSPGSFLFKVATHHLRECTRRDPASTAAKAIAKAIEGNTLLTQAILM